jgi:1,4-alpha-glucan branching enzyme
LTVTSPFIITQEHINPDTPFGANLIADGAMFRAWAPRALEVHLMLNGDAATWQTDASTLLQKDENTGIWSGFVAGVQDGDRYRFFVVGQGTSGFKRDPYARELGPNFPNCDCIVRDPLAYRWHDGDYRTPEFSDLVIYQFHIGTFYRVVDGQDDRPNHIAKLLDALKRMPDLADLGVNAVEPLPIDECVGDITLGYNGTDYFSPEEAYMVPPAEVGPYFDMVNNLLAAKGKTQLPQGALNSQVRSVRSRRSSPSVTPMGWQSCWMSSTTMREDRSMIRACTSSIGRSSPATPTVSTSATRGGPVDLPSSTRSRGSASCSSITVSSG